MSTNTDEIFAEWLHDHPELTVCIDDLMTAFDLMRTAFNSGGKVLLCGNGGSASDCEHFVGELMKSFEVNRPIGQVLKERLVECDEKYGGYIASKLQKPLPAISLTSQAALMTAISNDIAPDMVYAQQVLGYGKPNDVLIGISTSGNSANVLHAIRTAKAIDLHTIGFTGESGQMMRELCTVTLTAPYARTAQIQEGHLAMYHVLSRLLEGSCA